MRPRSWMSEEQRMVLHGSARFITRDGSNRELAFSVFSSRHPFFQVVIRYLERLKDR